MHVAVFHIIWTVFQLLLGYNLVLPVVLLILYISVKHKAYSAKKTEEADYAIIVTAYEQTHMLISVVDSLLSLQYSNYLIYIVADNCDTSELHFDDEKVILLSPERVLASNTRSHFYAIQRFKRAHTRLTIIDSDNLVDPAYLQKLNMYFEAGFDAVQGERKAKNLNSTYACIDAARDLYYHFYHGRVLFGIGSSATLAGSGMAFTVKLYRECLEQLDITGAGFDKILQKEIVTRGYRIAFAPEAIVYDEKTAKADQLINQRARWINTWFRYSKFGIGLVLKGIRTFNWNRFIFGIVLLRPPLFMFLIASLACLAVNMFINPLLASIWAAGFILFIIGFCISLWYSKPDQRIVRALWGIPKFVFYQLLSLLKVARANQHSVATKHSGIEG
jgi:cellulose synthase/poly-beta-1,6-N-acetylglucosamine synthase-like glycosyltransferase